MTAKQDSYATLRSVDNSQYGPYHTLATFTGRCRSWARVTELVHPLCV